MDGLSRRRRNSDSSSESEDDEDRERERPRLPESKVTVSSVVEGVLNGPQRRKGEGPGEPYRAPFEGLGEWRETVVKGEEARRLAGARTYAQKEEAERATKTPGRRPVASWEDDEELERVQKFLEDLERPKGLSERDVRSFLDYARKFFVSQGVLYRRSKEGLHQRVVVKPEEREAVLRGVHEELGHRGLFSTRRTLLDRYWWPAASQDVGIWVKGCEACQKLSDRKIVIPIEPSAPTQLF